MTECKPPDYKTGRRGKRWGVSLRAAQADGAKIIVEEPGVPVKFARESTGPGYFRPWKDRRGKRYDSYECIPYFP